MFLFLVLFFSLLSLFYNREEEETRVQFTFMSYLFSPPLLYCFSYTYSAPPIPPPFFFKTSSLFHLINTCIQEGEEEDRKEEATTRLSRALVYPKRVSFALVYGLSVTLYYLLVIPAPFIDIATFFISQTERLEAQMKEEEEEKEEAEKNAKRNETNSHISKIYYSNNPHLLAPRPRSPPLAYPLSLPLQREELQERKESKAPGVMFPTEENDRYSELFSRSFKKLVSFSFSLFFSSSLVLYLPSVVPPSFSLHFSPCLYIFFFFLKKTANLTYEGN